MTLSAGTDELTMGHKGIMTIGVDKYGLLQALRRAAGRRNDKLLIAENGPYAQLGTTGLD